MRHGIEIRGDGSAGGGPPLHLRDHTHGGTAQRVGEAARPARRGRQPLEVGGSGAEVSHAPAGVGQDGVEGGLGHPCVRVIFG